MRGVHARTNARILVKAGRSMTVAELASALNLTPVALGDPQREVTGGYAGDLLSWVMVRAQAGDAWVTIMSNANIVAVATLADTALIVLGRRRGAVFRGDRLFRPCPLYPCDPLQLLFSAHAGFHRCPDADEV